MYKLVIFAFFVAIDFSNTASIRNSNEIEEFERFLRNTIKGEAIEPATPELETLQNPWENSGKFEGDILLTEEQIKELVDEYSGTKNALTSQSRLWPSKTVVYNLTGPFTPAQESAIEAAIYNITRSSCLIFRKKTANDTAYISVQSTAGGCFATVGYTGRVQVVNFAPATPGTGCFRYGTLIHEFLHALGFYHMQSTHDRDDWVQIVWNKIQAGAEGNFNKYTSSQVTNLGQTYDYGSVLHYSEYGFSTDGSKTIIPLRATNITIGQRLSMSPKDVARLNRLYSCPIVHTID